MQSLIRSKSAGVTGGRGTAGAGPGRDLLYDAHYGQPPSLPGSGKGVRPAPVLTVYLLVQM